MPKTWRTVRVLVELPVRGDISNKDVVHDIQMALESQHTLDQLCSNSPGTSDYPPTLQFGKLRVKDFNRFVRTHRHPSIEGLIRKYDL